jgi:hypothetical protein
MTPVYLLLAALVLLITGRALEVQNHDTLALLVFAAMVVLVGLAVLYMLVRFVIWAAHR